MPVMPGLMVMPTVVGNTLLSFFKDRTYAVHSPDSLSIISPMYNEEKGAGQALTSLLEQDNYPEQIAVSINGSSDATYDVVTSVLKASAFSFGGTRALHNYNAILETWTAPHTHTQINVVVYYRKVSKSESINNLVESGIVNTDRILIVDGDTVFHPTFVRHLRENFYRLRITKTREERTFTLESYGLQSASVTSFTPPDATWAQRFISSGRKAEYAFSSVLREGQAKQLGDSVLLGNSRLYTVIGCGFAIRKDMFPMPTDTETEDHDFTLSCQNASISYELLSPAQLSERGFSFVIGGCELTAEEVFDPEDQITLKATGNARFVDKALMGTEDPPHFNGFIGQIERWNGGGQQNALKRIRQPLTANVHFTVWTALAESILGIVLLALLPILLALNVGNPSMGIPPVALGAWLGLDIVLTLFLVSYGFFKLRRAEGEGRLVALIQAVGNGFRNLLPFMVLRWLNPLTYVASATRVVPRYLFKKRRKKAAAVQGVTWERAYVKNRTRTQTVFSWTVLGFAVSTFAAANLAPYLNPINQEAWRLVYNAPFVDMRDFDDPFELQVKAQAEQAEVMLATALGSSSARPETLSRYCDPSFTRLTSKRHALELQGDPELYTELSRWGVRILARLAPIAPYLEDAATAYNVPVEFLLMVLLHESALDPLAVGPTDDKGLSQVTSDALTLLKAISVKPDSQFYNPQLIPETFNVYDPDFSICAGAAKLAWAFNQPEVDSEAKAYALYINPIHGMIRGEISTLHQPLVDGMKGQRSMAQQLASVFAVYAIDPDRLASEERKLLDVAEQRRNNEISLKKAYVEAYDVIVSNDISDAQSDAIFQKLLTSYFSDADALTTILAER